MNNIYKGYNSKSPLYTSLPFLNYCQTKENEGNISLPFPFINQTTTTWEIIPPFGDCCNYQNKKKITSQEGDHVTCLVFLSKYFKLGSGYKETGVCKLREEEGVKR